MIFEKLERRLEVRKNPIELGVRKNIDLHPTLELGGASHAHAEVRILEGVLRCALPGHVYLGAPSTTSVVLGMEKPRSPSAPLSIRIVTSYRILY